MTNDNDLRHGRHCVFKMHVHLVFVTKCRRCRFDAAALGAMRRIFSEVCSDFGAALVEFNGERDHVHLLVEYPPKVAVSRLVNSLKGVSSRRLKQEVPSMRGWYRDGALWSPSYFAASCGGAPLEMVKRYIDGQDAPR